MKHYTKLLRGYGLALLSAALLFSCSQIDTFESADLQAEANEASKSGFNLTPFGSTNGENNAVYSDEACIDECFKPNDPDSYFYLNGRENYNPQIFTDYKVYQTATHIFYEFSIAASNSSNPSILSYTLNGTTTSVGSNSFTVSYLLPAGWIACDKVSRTFTITRAGSGGGATGVTIPIDYKLIKICVDEPETCEPSFVWNRDQNDANTIIFEYTPHRSKAVAEIQITTPQITAFEAKDGKVYSQFGNISQGNGGLRWTGELVCGQTITFTIKFTPINCNNPNNLPANMVSNFVVKDMGGNKLQGNPIQGDCVVGG